MYINDRQYRETITTNFIGTTVTVGMPFHRRLRHATSYESGGEKLASSGQLVTVVRL